MRARSNPDSQENFCYFTGINGDTGTYLTPPQPLSSIADLARSEPRYGLAAGKPQPAKDLAGKGPTEGIDPRDLAQTGWGVIWGPVVPPPVREALGDLLAFRKGQAGERFRELDYKPAESKTRFLARHAVPAGAADPQEMPYYLLLVGHPDEIPFEFQFQLDIRYAVGRIAFHSIEEYRRYARGVVAVESGEVRRSRCAAFFAPSHSGDPATDLTVRHLVGPLVEHLLASRPDWETCAAYGEEATKNRLARFLAGEEAPALLFTASHGLLFSPASPLQSCTQGALVCSDWPGPRSAGPVREDHYFASRDLSDQATVQGLISFHFACFGAGTPQWDDFETRNGRRERLAQRPFLSSLPQRLLAHPAGAALAVVGHIDKTWAFQDFKGKDLSHRGVLEDTLKRLLAGYPLGYAMEYVSSCYVELASDLDEEVRRRRSSDQRLARLWTDRNDARNFVLLGDPAVRLAVAEKAAETRGEGS